MQIASVVGGFSLGQADMLRRAMGKKKKDVMDEMKVSFIDGAIAQKFPGDIADHILELCYKFAEYGFNKSHSAAYAMISYQTGYLKANYMLEYMTALLSSVSGNLDKLELFVKDCRQLGLTILPPDVNRSCHDFTCMDKDIIYGLGAIKNVGEAAIENIVDVRQNGQRYTGFIDFCERVDLKLVNKRVFESLIRCGA